MLRPVTRSSGFFRKLLTFTGPGYLVAVGYMDPGNWATGIAAGSGFGYKLLWVILLSNMMAVLLQSLSAKLGIVTGRDLAQTCRGRYRRSVNLGLWLSAELAIVATDLAEVIGTAIALRLLFGLPVQWGVVLTALNVFAVLYLQGRGYRYVEALIVTLIGLICACFAFELLAAQPQIGAIITGLVPTSGIVSNPDMLFIAVGIVGATVMPHNLYLHSAIVQTRLAGTGGFEKREAVRWAVGDTCIALSIALLINGAILIVAAATFHARGFTHIAGLEEVYRLLAPLLNVPAASVVLGLALLLSGLNSTVTATFAGQIVMEGFLDLRLSPARRQLATRALAIVPAALVTVIYGEQATTWLLLLSQVILSLQLPLAMIPLIRATGDANVMGSFANSAGLGIAAWGTAALIFAFNIVMVLGWLNIY
jgi:manganese transport protein